MSDHMDQLRRSVIRVGGGRGFVVSVDEDTRLVVTAAHCLPEIPQTFPIMPEERTFIGLLGLPGEDPSVACEVLFVDPIADVAILGKPDGQELWEQARAYEAMTEPLAPVPLTARKLVREILQMPTLGTIQRRAMARDDGWLLSLSGEWFQCSLTIDRDIWVSDAAQPLVGGMSGSPIVLRGGALGVFCQSGGNRIEHQHREGGPNPYLAAALPGWMAGAFVRLL